jgi:hypothetical protein
MTTEILMKTPTVTRIDSGLHLFFSIILFLLFIFVKKKNILFFITKFTGNE